MEVDQTEYQKVAVAADYIKSRMPFKPKVGIILGTGHGEWAAHYPVELELQTHEVPNMVTPKVVSHQGRIVFTTINGIDVALLAGRVHYYEGYEMNEVIRGVRILHEIGCTHLVITNAAGGLNTSYQNGEIVLITDHINLMNASPLRGPNEAKWGPRFPDMSNAYDRNWIAYTQDQAKRLNLQIKTGIYAGNTGPNLETPAEYAYLHRIGADLVGMSAVPEVIAARHLGMTLLAVSVVSNMCYPPEIIKETSVEDVIRVVNENAKKAGVLIEASLPFCMT
jgi:purine-nucleoside phosphorylase